MNHKKQLWLLLGSIAVFLAAFFMYAVDKQNFLYPIMLPFGLIVVYLLFFRVDILVYLLAFLTPLSIPLKEFGFAYSFDVTIPSEPIMIMLMLLLLCRILYDLSFEKELRTHPVTVAIALYFVWLLISCITSEMPIVSIKAVLSQMWFVCSSYFMVLYIMRNNFKNIVTFFTFHAIGIAIVVLYTTLRHFMMGFSKETGYWIMSPFYNDHTAYGAITGFMLPIVFFFIFLPDISKKMRILYIFLSGIIAAGLYLSFSRAAWLSVVGAAVVWFILKLKIKFKWILLTTLLMGCFFYFFADDIVYKMSKNEQNSSRNFSEQLQSITNISTDDSNLERLNRWVSAWGMIKDRPLVGWGPGTYQFQYAPYQKSEYETKISTSFGNGGSVHSEYFLSWSETGSIGLLTVLSMIVLILYYGVKTYKCQTNPMARWVGLAMLLALVTYFIHGIMNNFLDTDKLALPYWAAFAAIVGSSTFSEKKQNTV
jgi:O-antigen ligase